MTTHTNLARLFLVGVAVMGIYLALFGVAPDGLSLVPCPFFAMTGVGCPGCGMTRACLALTQGDFAAAWGFHPFSFLLVGLAVAVSFCPGSCHVLWRRVATPMRILIYIGLISLCLGLWIYRWFL